MNGSLRKLATILNWGEQSMCYRTGLLCRGTCTGPEKGPCDGLGLEHRVYKGRLGTVGWFSLGKRRGRRDLSTVCSCLVGGRR